MTGMHNDDKARQPGQPGFVLSSDGLGVTRVTQWFRHDHINGWQFNHLEDGHVCTTHPTPKFDSQNGWRRATWARYHVYLTDDIPPKVVHFGRDA